MNPSQRPVAAAIAASLVNRARYHRVYDHAAEQYLEIGVDTRSGEVAAFDYGRRAHVSGAPESVYDHGAQSHLQFDVNGAVVRGYDYGSGFHFHASVADTRIDFFDYAADAYFTFQVA